MNNKDMKEEIVVTNEMAHALHVIKDTSNNLFITGKAGTGKTTLLKYLTNNCKKNYIITAPTGVAAINAGGVTIHSAFGLPCRTIDIDDFDPNVYLLASRADVLKNLQLLIIDEISMVRPDMLDAVDITLQVIRDNQLPFGGVQVVMFGDMYQLPPVVTKDDKEIISKQYKDIYFFNARVWEETTFDILELNTVFRQKDDMFVNILNKIRNYSVTHDDLMQFGNLKDKKKSEDYSSGAVHICTHRNTVAKINEEMLGKEERTYKASLSGQFSDSAIPCDGDLKLRVGARVMCLINDSSKGCYNGMLGNVTKLSKKVVTVQMDNGSVIEFENYKWSNKKYEYDKEKGMIVEKEVGTCEQIPLTLAWAITIHKSQGLTFDNVVLHIARTFCPGQLYVALSRCKSMEGIVLDTYITKRMIKPADSLLEFEEICRNNNQVFAAQLMENRV